MEKLNYILKQVKIIDPRSKHNGKIRDILIEGGKITKISKKINFKKQFIEIKKKNLHISPGFFDLNTRIGEPGNEYKEDKESGSNSLKNGGYTGFVYMPSTKPPIQNSSDINFIKNLFKKNILDVFPTGCITKDMKGLEITEMNDMRKAGAITFTDDLNSIDNPKVMSIALEYSKLFENPIFIFPFEKRLCVDGQINEGKMSTLLGIKGIPNISEEIRVNRDIELVKYNDGRLHFSTISSFKSLQLIKKAKENKINVTCDIPAYQLILNDEMISEFDPNLKVLPPIRNKLNQKKLIQSIKKGMIDAISSNHHPVELEKKKCSFKNSEFGMIGLETSFSIINTVLKNVIKLDKLIELISINPKKILNIECPKIEENEKANLTLFDPDKKWVYKNSDIKSKSKNSPFINYKFTGKTLGIFNNGIHYLND